MKDFFNQLKIVLIAQLKGAAVKAALKSFLGSSAGAGFKAWLVTFITKELFSQLGEPLIKALLTEIGYGYYKVEGEHLVRQLNTAKKDNDKFKYNKTSDDIFN